MENKTMMKYPEMIIHLITVRDANDADLIKEACEYHLARMWSFCVRKTTLGFQVDAEYIHNKRLPNEQVNIANVMMPKFAQGVYAGIALARRGQEAK